jgi:deoxycytidine triphosphate deaminase
LGREIARTCFAGEGTDHHLRVDLTSTAIHGVEGCGFRAKTPSSTSEPIPLRKERGVQRPDPSRSWELVQSNRHGLLKITKNHFYILRSKERLSVPPGIAVYARAIDEEIGEMRIHYAGFAHPFFGWERADGTRGTPLIFEVRGHDVDVSLRDNEILARLRFFRMSEDAVRTEADEDYNEQNLKLSKYFADWSTPPALAEVEAD